MPTTAFTEIEVESVRLIVGLGTSPIEQTELEDKLAALNDGQADAVRSEIVAWNKVRYGTTRVKGGIKGTDYSMDRERLQLTNDMRLRLGYPLINSVVDENDIGFGIFRGLGWAGSEDDGE